jgi:hypothetical protein
MSGQSPPTGEDLPKVVKAAITQDYEATFNIRLVPARSLEDPDLTQRRCMPRGHAPGWDYGILTIDPGLAGIIAKGDKPVIAWLAKDAANAQHFLANPVAALREAGVELTREQEKALTRSIEAASATRVVGPGVKIASLSARAYPKGRVGGVRSGRTDGKPGARTDDFGCEPRRKG